MARQTSATIIERKTRLDGSTEDYQSEPLVNVTDRPAVLRYVMERSLSIEGTGLTLRPGHVTVSHYWSDRPYNVYHWIDEGRTLAYYCNVVGETTIREDLVAYTDLVVDVFLRPSGEALHLDEEELPPDHQPARRAVIARAVETIMSGPPRLIAEIERETKAALGPR